MSDLDINSLARGDSHMVARFLNAWNAANAERATWPLPWDDDYETRPVSTENTEYASTFLGKLTYAWVRHLLRESGVRDGDTPPPTASQRRRLARLLNLHAESDDDGLQVLSYWARLKLRGDEQRLIDELNRLAGDMQLKILNSIVNHVRSTSPEYNGQPLTFSQKPIEAPKTGNPEVDAKIAEILKDSE